MKKVFAIVLAIIMTMSVMLGCSNDKKETPPASLQTKTAQSAETVSNQQSAAKQKNEKIKAKDKQEKKQYGQQGANQSQPAPDSAAKVAVEKGKAYTDKDHVAAYIHVYKTLPPNYITKGQANKLGWKTKGTLDKVAPGKSIGGDRFGNYEKILPDKPGRTWKECDIDYVRGNRNAKRICFSNDGLIYYSGSHYRDFERLY
ncbi:MAG: ribonuclease domain-containing protein [Succiniclasticum sp.]|uniref:ribonuclease domain-containing protein n=1 Tax=Succiniclasticum sp. TaxID=2775030 RepID=UPI002A91E15A|nr:ribonuclease domain-containing protein [Succiniclasticum sp.]MDY6291415.1 ribonuclease domain-containing protein [Succiniclasticum sp.]